MSTSLVGTCWFAGLVRRADLASLPVDLPWQVWDGTPQETTGTVVIIGAWINGDGRKVLQSDVKI